jgi:hypothetical protein
MKTITLKIRLFLAKRKLKRSEREVNRQYNIVLTRLYDELSHCAAYTKESADVVDQIDKVSEMYHKLKTA